MIARRILFTFFALALASAVPAFSQAADTSAEELAAQLASTPEQHKAVASYYRGKAEEARTEAQRHRTMAQTYGGGKYVEKKAMEDHCKNLVTTYETLAKQYDELAADHEASAK